MANKVKLTDQQRSDLKAVGVKDPDEWLRNNVRSRIADQTSQTVADKIIADAVRKETEKPGKVRPLDKAKPDTGEAWVKADGSIVVGKVPPDGVYVFKSMEPNEDGTVSLKPMGKGAVATDPRSGRKLPQFTEMTQDGGKTYFKVAQNPQTGKYQPADQKSADVAAATTATSKAKPWTPIGTSPDEQANAMTPEEEQSLLDNGFTPQEVATAKAARGGKVGYTSPYLSDKPGNTEIYRRGTTKFGPSGQTMDAERVTIDDQLKSMYQLPPDKLKELQTQLFQGGYYSQSKLEDVPLGTPDQSTLKAYYDFLSDVARRNAAGQPVTVEDMLASVAANGVKKAEESKPKYQPIDARDAALVADQVAQQVLGRKATAADQRLILAALNQAGQLSFTAQQNNTVATNPASPTAVATDVLQKQNPQESLGYGLLDQFHTFAAMLGPSGGVT